MIKHRITATVTWDLYLPENEPNVSNLAKETLLAILPKNLQPQIKKINGNKDKGRNEKITLGEFSLEDVFSKLNDKRAEFQVGDEVHIVRMSSHRYFVFQNNSACVACGIPGKKFLLERHPNDKSPHFNMYGEEDGQLILMTKDHIQAKAKGGIDDFSNYETMCSVCNNLKAEYQLDHTQVKSLRELWNACKAQGDNRKEISKKIREYRNSIASI